MFSILTGQTSAANRIYPMPLPQTPTFPAVTYQQLGRTAVTRAMGTDGAGYRVRLQVDTWAKTYADARALAAEVATRLNRFRGDVAGVTVCDCLLDNELDLYEPDIECRRVMQEYSLFLTTTD